MPDSIAALMAHQAPEGVWQTVVNIPTRFGGSGEAEWRWMACDAPTLLYSLVAFGLDGDPRVQEAVEHLLTTVHTGQAVWLPLRLSSAS